ncbi:MULTISPECIES: autotransporter domain-containing protein, partial [unclassified Polaromonas]
TTLTGANTYTGGTTITAGTLALGNGGTTGTITGNVANSGTLAFNRSDAAAFDGAISGTGSVEQRGTGTTTLSGVNTYSGGTSVLNGTLAGGAASLGSGAIVNNAALVIDQAGDGSLNNVLSGAGRITKTGAGALTLGGNSAAFAGSTQVTAGMLAVNGSLGGAVTVGNGARLAGTGSVGNTAVQSGATVAPGGNSIGTLNVAGNLTLAQGSVYQLNAASDGRSDQLRVSGVAALQGGNVSVLASGNFQPTTTYSILTANGGVSGQFAGATTDMAFLNPSLTYSPQNVTLRLQRNQVSLQNIAQTPNQRAAAGALSALDTGPLYSAIVQLNAANARTAFDSLSGEVHASLKSAAFEDSRFVRNASLGRLRESFDTPAATATDAPAASGSGVWVQAVDSWGSTDADGNASSLERTTRGIFLGADTRVGDDWRVGVLGGYSKSRVTPDDLPSLAKTDTYHVGVYGGKQWGQLGLRAGATYSAGKADTRRDIAFPGFSGQTTAKYDINTTQAFGELGWKMPMANGSLEPFAGLAHVKLSTDGFTESGGVAGLSGSNSSTHATYSTLGLRGTTNAGMPNNQTRLRGLVGWRHAFGDVTPTSALALAGQPGFSVAGVPIARNALVLEGGIDFAVSRNLTMGVSYVGQASSQVSDHGIKASLLWKF